MSFNDVMQNILAPTSGYQPGVTHDEDGIHQCFGAPRVRRGGTHEGVDINYVNGQNGINREYPDVGSPVNGTVLYTVPRSGMVVIKDAYGNIHEILHLDTIFVSQGDIINEGTAIGLMGGRGDRNGDGIYGASEYAPHVHYQMKDQFGELIDPVLYHDNSKQGGCPPLPDKEIEKHKELFKQAQTRTSPLVLDLDGDGVETTAINNGAYFDHDASGFAESTGWVSADDGLLALDRNGDGRISDGTELFGNQTLFPDGSQAGNGFQALTQWDGNGDGRIDANDAVWSQLQIWRDQNEDGYSEAGELYSLSDFGIVSLDTGYSDATVFVDAQGNEHRQQGGFTRADGITGTVTDVWFQSDRTYTIAEQIVDMPADIAAMPNARGYGNVYDLQQAMARDASGSLVSLVQQFSNQTDPAQRAAILEQILFVWTGSEGIDPTSRGGSFDARKLDVLEKFFGEPYANGALFGGGPNPQGGAIPELTQSYNGLVEMVDAQLMAQTHLRGLYDLITYRFTNASGVTGDLTQVANELYSNYASSEISGETTFLEFVRTIKAIDGNGSIILDSLRINNTMSWLLDTYGQTRITGNELDNSLSGTGSSEVIRGNGGNDTLDGNGGNDTLDGGAGDDVITVMGSGTNMLRGGDGNDIVTFSYDADNTIDGGTGDDLIMVNNANYSNYLYTNTFIGGTGNDRIQAAAAADTYVFNRGDGQDTINDYGYGYAAAGNDTLVFGAGIAASDLMLSRNDNHLVIQVTDPANPLAIDQITIENWDTAGYRIETVAFADGTVWSAQTLSNLAMTGTEAADTITLWSDATFADGRGGDDIITDAGYSDATAYGGAGNDTITDAGGNDTLDGGAGDDVITDQRWGTNVLSGGDGNDTITFSFYADNIIDGGADDDLIMVDNATYSNYSYTNTFTGGTGNDRIQSGASTDTYLFNRGDGADTINDYGYGYAPAGDDKLVFGAGIAQLDITLARNGDNLLISDHGSVDSVTVENWYNSSVYQVEQIALNDGTKLLNTQVDQLIQAMATFSASHGGISWDQAVTQNPNEVQAVLTAYWQPGA
jgi:hypothetical protein